MTLINRRTILHPFDSVVILILLLFIEFSCSTKNIDSESPTLDFTKYSENDSRHWYTMARAEIRERIEVVRPIHKKAKNVIIFLGDGMGISTITASRIMKGQINGQRGEEGYLEFDRFPYTGLIKTYNLDKQVPDSAGTATAYLGGVKANFFTVGVDGNVRKDEPNCKLVHESAVSSILLWAQQAGKGSGFVTTTRVTHATPAASYAHTQNRDWEANVPGEGGEHGPLMNKQYCKDIASQLIDSLPGSKLNVAMGGGRANFLPRKVLDPKGTLFEGKIKPIEGKRNDGRNLIAEWKNNHHRNNNPTEYSYVNSTQTLAGIDYRSTKFLLGLFNHTNMEYESLRDKGPDGEPSLTEMVTAAIKVLNNHDNGFVLLVEAGRIDHAHHDGYSNLALLETIELDRAIRKAREMISMDESLILVTADHSHALTINGYPKRGNPISGFGGHDDFGTPYTTLMYANGPGYREPEALMRLASEDTNYAKFRPHAGVRVKDTHHGGEDVAVFAIGPMAHLFGGTHEQSYIAHVMAYSACIGQFRNADHCSTTTEHNNNNHGNIHKPSIEARRSRQMQLDDDHRTNGMLATIPFNTTILGMLLSIIILGYIV